MKKKILFMFAIFISLTFVANVNATTCEYKLLSDTKYNILTGSSEKNYDSDIVSAKFVYKSKDNGKIWTQLTNPYDLYCSISNWNEPVFGTSVLGKEYIINETCPEKLLIYIDSSILGSAKEIFLPGSKCTAYISKEDTRDTIVKGIIGKWNINKHIVELERIEKSGQVDTTYSSCLDFNEENDCKNNAYYSCMWVKKKVSSNKTVEYCNFDDLTYVRCGDAWDIPKRLPVIVSFLINLLKIAAPIILIFVSVISLVKAVAASKEDEIKKAQNTLVRRLITAVMVFFVIQITQFVILKVADSSDSKNISSCLSCFINNDCSKNVYYKTNVNDSYKCTYLSDITNHEHKCN